MECSQHTDDWCHFCGSRRHFLADVFYPKNAEHQKENTEYIRICNICAIYIQEKAERTIFSKKS